MTEFILVRHSNSAVDLTKPAATWGLTEAGKANCYPLAQQLASHNLTAVFTSHEPKALQTGQIIGEVLGIRVQTAVNLHEHDRSNVREMGGEEFKRNVARLFTDPDALFFGTESGRQAQCRFTQAVQAVLQNNPNEKVAIVAHGTVITLFLAAYNDIEPISFWQALKMPDWCVVDAEMFALRPDTK